MRIKKVPPLEPPKMSFDLRLPDGRVLHFDVDAKDSRLIWDETQRIVRHYIKYGSMPDGQPDPGSS